MRAIQTANGAFQHCIQRLLFDWLGEKGIHAGSQKLLFMFIGHIRRQGHNHHLWIEHRDTFQPTGTNRTGRLQAIHFRHVAIHQHHVVALPCQRLYRQPAVLHQRYLVPHLFQQGLDDDLVGLHIFRTKHLQAVLVLLLRLQIFQHWRHAQWQGKHKFKRCTDPQLAADADFAAHGFHQLAADHQAEAGAAKTARRGIIGLLKTLEQFRQALGRNADTTILHLEAHAALGAVIHLGLGRHHDLTVLGELDGVAGQIHQHLPDTGWIATEITRQVFIDIDDKTQPLVARQLGDGFQTVKHHRQEFEIDRLNRQLAGFDFGKVENIVDDGQQGFAAAQRQPHLAPGFGLQLFVAQRKTQHADHAIQRGADFMAHAGQEKRLGFGCRFCLFPRLLQLAQHLLAILNVQLDGLRHAVEGFLQRNQLIHPAQIAQPCAVVTTGELFRFAFKFVDRIQHPCANQMKSH